MEGHLPTCLTVDNPALPPEPPGPSLTTAANMDLVFASVYADPTQPLLPALPFAPFTLIPQLPVEPVYNLLKEYQIPPSATADAELLVVYADDFPLVP